MILSLIVPFVSSCTATRKTTESESNRKEFNYIIQTRTSGVPESTAKIKIDVNELLQLQPGQTYQAKQGQATATAEKQGDTIFISAKCDSLTRELERLEAYLSESETNQTTEEKQTGYPFKTVLKYCLIGVLAGFSLFPLFKFLLKQFIK